MKINAIKQFFILSCVMLFSSLDLTAQKTNFSGVWGINISKSDFGNVPSNVAVQQFDINQKDDTVFIKRIIMTPDGSPITINEKISVDGNPCTSTTYDGKTKASTISWSPDQLIMTINSVYSLPGKPEMGYKISQNWSLSKDGNELMVSMVTPGYSIRAAYSKVKKGDIVAKEKEPFFDPKVITIPKIIFYSVIPGFLIMYASFLLFTRKKK